MIPSKLEYWRGNKNRAFSNFEVHFLWEILTFSPWKQFFIKNIGLNLDFLPNITCRKRHFLNQFIPWPLTVSVSETKSRLFQLPCAHDVPVKFWKFKSNRCDDLMLNGGLYLVAAIFQESNLFSISNWNIARATTDAVVQLLPNQV